MVETMKKRIIMILAAACILVVSGCGAASVSQEAKTAETAADMQTTADIQQGLKLTTTEMDGMELRSVLNSNPPQFLNAAAQASKSLCHTPRIPGSIG